MMNDIRLSVSHDEDWNAVLDFLKAKFTDSAVRSVSIVKESEKRLRVSVNRSEGAIKKTNSLAGLYDLNW